MEILITPENLLKILVIIETTVFVLFIFSRLLFQVPRLAQMISEGGNKYTIKNIRYINILQLIAFVVILDIGIYFFYLSYSKGKLEVLDIWVSLISVFISVLIWVLPPRLDFGFAQKFLSKEIPFFIIPKQEQDFPSEFIFVLNDFYSKIDSYYPETAGASHSIEITHGSDKVIETIYTYTPINNDYGYKLLVDFVRITIQKKAALESELSQALNRALKNKQEKELSSLELSNLLIYIIKSKLRPDYFIDLFIKIRKKVVDKSPETTSDINVENKFLVYNFFEVIQIVLNDETIPENYKRLYAENSIPIFTELRNLWSKTKPSPSENNISFICDTFENVWEIIIEFITGNWDDLGQHHLGLKRFRDRYILNNKNLQKFEASIEKWINDLENIDPNLRSG